MQVTDLRNKFAKADLSGLLKRPAIDSSSLEKTVAHVLKDVKEQGDDAVRKFTLQFDKAAIDELQVSESDIEAASLVPAAQLKMAIAKAKENIERFHLAQQRIEPRIETMPGVTCWRKAVAIEKVGLYIPGGTAPLFSTILMLGIPAVIAGCREIILCSPPGTDGKLNPSILYAARLVGVTKIFRVGGVQAIAAMSYGTQSIPKVHKIFGPGNQYVTCAKQLVQKEGMAIDLPAGPSELAVYADNTAQASFIAADLLSQAEHGIDSQVVLITCHEPLIMAVQKELDEQVAKLPRKNIATQALRHAKAILLSQESEAIDLINEYAPEHLILSCENPASIADRIVNAGSVFLGHFAPETVGDYASGTNHTLPTNGSAKAYGGVSLDSFLKYISFQELTKQGLINIGEIAERLAAAEGLEAHKNAVSIRLNSQR